MEIKGTHIMYTTVNYDKCIDEFRDIVAYTLEQVNNFRCKNIKFSTENNRICASKDTIFMPKESLKNIFEGLFTLNILDKTIYHYITTYKISEHPNYIKKCIYLFSILGAFFHELGHIIQNHHKPIGVECFQFAKENFDSFISDSRKERWIEYDADVFSSISLRSLLETKIDIKANKDEVNAKKDIIVISILYLYHYLLSNLTTSELYPPLSVRIMTLVFAFLGTSVISYDKIQECSRNMVNIKIDVSQNDADRLIALNRLIAEDFKNNIGCNVEALNFVQLKEWFDDRDEMMKFLTRVHKNTL